MSEVGCLRTREAPYVSGHQPSGSLMIADLSARMSLNEVLDLFP